MQAIKKRNKNGMSSDINRSFTKVKVRIISILRESFDRNRSY
jgi:hypothetical protein